MNVLFIGKRFYTNRDALREKYGRIWQLPWHWAQAGIPTRLWLVDYHTHETVRNRTSGMTVVSTPVRNLSAFRQWFSESTARAPKPDIVVASGDCYVGLMAFRIARRLKASFVFDVYDKYDEFRGYLRLAGFDPFSYLLGKADICLFASRPLMEQVGRESSSNLLVPNGIDTNMFRPLDMQACRDKVGLALDSIVVGYFGSMTPDRGVSDLVAAIAMLRNRNPRLSLLLAGGERNGESQREPWIRDLGNLPYDRVPEAMACCDILALPYRHSAYLDMAASCKIAEYIAVQRPLAVTNTPNFSVNFPDQTAALAPLLAAPGNPNDLARVISLQIEEQRLVSLPKDISWNSIAANVARSAKLDANRAVIHAKR